ncbi:MAG: rod-binding protein [Gemmatimonadota bacterium]|nr:rod-binding protein [Gemmatimonadota bacterium]MDH5758214.1 rod-binding protein [Gemmatimonadota bacterium]
MGRIDAFEALKNGRIQGKEARLRAAADLMEGTFYQEIFKAMRETVPEGGALSGGAGEDMFQSLMDQHIADAAAQQSERGIGSALYRHFARNMGLAEAAQVVPAMPGADTSGSGEV